MKKFFLSLMIAILIPASSSFAQESVEDLINLFEEEETFSGKVFVEAEKIAKNIVKVDVKASELNTPTIGIAFHLKYDTSGLSFLRYEPGDFLEAGGDPIYLVKNISEQGKIIFGSTLTHQDAFPLGGDKLVSFYFETTTNQNEFLFEFERGSVSSTEEVMQDLVSIDWQNFYGSILESASENDSINSNSIENEKPNIALYTAGLLSFLIIILVAVFILVKRKSMMNRRLAN